MVKGFSAAILFFLFPALSFSNELLRWNTSDGVSLSEALSAFIQTNISLSDNEYTFLPETLLSNRSGDCDDVALFCYRVFSDYEMDARLVIMDLERPVNNENGTAVWRHVACFFYDNGWCSIDNYGVNLTYSEWGAFAVFPYTNQITRARFLNPAPRLAGQIQEVLEVWDSNDSFFFYVKNREPEILFSPLETWFYTDPLSDRELLLRVIQNSAFLD